MKRSYFVMGCSGTFRGRKSSFREARFIAGQTKESSHAKSNQLDQTRHLSSFPVEERPDDCRAPLSRRTRWRRIYSRKRSSPTRPPSIRTIQTMGSNVPAASSSWPRVHARSSRIRSPRAAGANSSWRSPPRITLIERSSGLTARLLAGLGMEPVACGMAQRRVQTRVAKLHPRKPRSISLT